ncbi:hypothetical protein SAMN05421810_103598 [Amycolatopsis arida]|uniref:Uncharacterized protein n=1 Tax=Amycolatopsis arida TaxID=587909 RepID=A0A1I5TP57_9PSEU|nr:chaplin family protein [Amycolatopsis arida]TDX96024.1 hypothetical protein CLV69_103159 [Amycolatopsis arida]SFP84823.1 hypothetical protein SAMN05421810_103598 [Amycolatopsis arida]
MQTWAKRGLQTALVTGGLLMLGTGIASADEKVDPDAPLSPVDLSLGIPIQFHDNAVGTPLGQANLPGHEQDISTKSVTQPVHEATGKTKVGEIVSTVPLETSGIAEHLPSGGSFEPTDDILKGNKLDGDIVAPIQVCGNVISVVGDAAVDGSDCRQAYHSHDDTVTEGHHSGTAGNALVFDWALPVQVSGNAGGLVGGSGYTHGTASQEVTETGNISTSGTGSAASGNVLAGQFATPIQITGNAGSWILANAYSDYTAATAGESGGWIYTNGDGGSVSGNVVGAPVALPLRLNGNAASAWGSDADSVSCASAEAEAGTAKKPGINNVPSYIQTGGKNAFVAGNIAQPQGAVTGNIAGVAASWIGNASTGHVLGSAGSHGWSSGAAEAGGQSSTTGVKSMGSGNLADVPIALPVEACGVGGSYIGNAHAAHDCNTVAVVGSDTYTNGNESFIGGNGAHLPLALAGETFGVGVSHIGNASGVSHEAKHVQAGGYNGTLGDDSTLGGNLVGVPAAVPVEMFGVGASYLGQGTGEATEVKRIKAGDKINTADDDGFGSSNLLAAPLSIPAQVFGVGLSHLGRGTGSAVADTITEAGGDAIANGSEAGLAGNIGHVPVAAPLQAHGLGGSLVGTASGEGDNLTDAIAGGNADTDGVNGAMAGNILAAPVAGAGTVSNASAGLGALVSGKGTNDVVAAAGGDSITNGAGGDLAGNVISAQGMPVAQAFGDAVAVVAKATGEGRNLTDVTSGGDITTSGVDGGFSGNIFDLPLAAVAQFFGNSVAIAGLADAVGHNVTTGKVSGITTTSQPDLSTFTGIDTQTPVVIVAQVWNLPIEVLGEATSQASNLTTITVDNQEPRLDPPVTGSELPIDGLPSLPVADLPLTGGVRGLHRVDLPGLAGPAERSELPGVSGLPLDALTPAEDVLPRLDLGTLPSLDSVKVMPQAEVPALAQLDNNPTSLFQAVLDGLGGGSHLR